MPPDWGLSNRLKNLSWIGILKIQLSQGLKAQQKMPVSISFSTACLARGLKFFPVFLSTSPKQFQITRIRKDIRLQVLQHQCEPQRPCCRRWKWNNILRACFCQPKVEKPLFQSTQRRWILKLSGLSCLEWVFSCACLAKGASRQSCAEVLETTRGRICQDAPMGRVMGGSSSNENSQAFCADRPYAKC